MEEMSFSLRDFAAAFADAPRPAREEIALHRCGECERVRSDFSGYAVADVPDEVMIYHSDSIPLLSPAAYRYYLPRYVRLTCERPDTNATDFLLFNLCPDDPGSEFWSGRCDAFTRRECEAIVSYLRHRQTWPDADADSEWLEPAIEFWRGLADARLT